MPEKNLRNFCERAVGVNTDKSYADYYWDKEGNYEKKVFGLPIVPDKYKHLIRQPIETEIVSVGKKKFSPEYHNSNGFGLAGFRYFVALGAGKDKKIKAGMDFYVEDLGEWIEITKVSPKSSVGFIKRDADENKQENCRDSAGGSGDLIPCKEIKAGMKAKTTGKDYF